METIALPDQSALGRLASYLKLARAFKHLKEFSYFREGYDTRIGAALKGKAVLMVGMYLSANTVGFFKDYDVAPLPMQVESGAQACQSGTNHDDLMLLFHVYIGLEKFLSVWRIKGSRAAATQRTNGRPSVFTVMVSGVRVIRPSAAISRITASS